MPATSSEFRWGEGRISGFISAAFGLASLAGVFCFLYPDLLTTPELVARFEVLYLRVLLLGGLVVAFALGMINFLIGRRRALGGIGMAAATVAVLLGGAAAQDRGYDLAVLPLGLDWLVLGLLFSAMLFIPIEKAFPRKPDQPILRAEWDDDLAYFAMTHLLVSVITAITTASGPLLLGWAVNGTLQGWVSSMPWAVQFFLVVFLADLAQYVSHRWYHESAFMWRFHAVHHSSKTMDWLASSRLHLGEVLITRICVFLPLYAMGFADSVLYAYIAFVGIHAVFIHTNCGLRFGWLDYLVVTPRYHHWHHADAPEAINKNYAVHLPVLDILLGTYYQPRGQWPDSYGVAHDPPPDGILRQHLHPFTPRRKPGS